MHVFFCTDIIGDRLVLSRDESTHAIKVLRLQSGDKALVLDGRGHRFLCRYEDARQKQCFFSILETENVTPRSVQLTMAVAPTKQIDRFEWFLEKATEIGVEQIVPIISQNSERKVIKVERCMKILIAAIKQSRNAYLPQISEPITFDQYIRDTANQHSDKFIAHCYSDTLPHLMAQNLAPNITVLIGPEGDFTTSEVAQAQQSGWKEISLGQNRLRTETAAIVAVHTVALKQL